MSPKCSSMYFLAILVLFAYLFAIALAAGRPQYDEPCSDTSTRSQDKCEDGKGYACDVNTKKCMCLSGHYSQEKKKCVANMNEECGLKSGTTGNIECENVNSQCNVAYGTPDYGKCVCKEGMDCSSGVTLGPTIITTTIGLCFVAFTFMKLY